jgi:hypothetical protein
MSMMAKGFMNSFSNVFASSKEEEKKELEFRRDSNRRDSNRRDLQSDFRRNSKSLQDKRKQEPMAPKPKISKQVRVTGKRPRAKKVGYVWPRVIVKMISITVIVCHCHFGASAKQIKVGVTWCWLKTK